jgi:hypothetical protein
MGTQKGQKKGVLPWLVRLAYSASRRDFCSALAALVGPVLNIFSSPYTISIPLSPSPSNLAVVLGRLSLKMCLWSCQEVQAGPQLVPLCAFPQLAQQGKLLRMCALFRSQMTAELRLRTKKKSCGPYFHYAQFRR